MGSLVEPFFIWCAGSDKHILQECPESERIKHCGYGILLCIPPILGFISMTYALSTFVENSPICIACGILWGIIVFFYDRFAVSTFRKSINTTNPIRTDVKSAIFKVRLILAFVVSIAVSHPFTLFFFHDVIEKKIEDLRQEKTKGITDEYNTRIAPFLHKIDTLEKVAVAQRQIIANLRFLLVEEVSAKTASAHAHKLPSTISIPLSGVYGDGTTAKTIREITDGFMEDLEHQLQRNTKDSVKAENEILKLKQERDTVIAHIEMARDYSARYSAFTKKANEDPHLYVVYFFIFIFFLVVDIVPVVYKVFTQAGPYDHKISESERLFSDPTTIYYSVLKNAYNKVKDNISDSDIKNHHDEFKEKVVQDVKKSLSDIYAVLNAKQVPTDSNDKKSEEVKSISISESMQSGFILVLSLIILAVLIKVFGPTNINKEKYLGYGFMFTLSYTILKDNVKNFGAAYKYILYGKTRRKQRNP